MSEEMFENKSSDSMLSDSDKELSDFNKELDDFNIGLSDLGKEMSDLNKELDNQIKKLNDFNICCIILLLDFVLIWYIHEYDLIQDYSKHSISLLQVLMIVNFMLFYFLEHLFRKYKFL